jgi:hypothetical protein
LLFTQEAQKRKGAAIFLCEKLSELSETLPQHYETPSELSETLP